MAEIRGKTLIEKRTKIVEVSRKLQDLAKDSEYQISNSVMIKTVHPYAIYLRDKSTIYTLKVIALAEIRRCKGYGPIKVSDLDGCHGVCILDISENKFYIVSKNNLKTMFEIYPDEKGANRYHFTPTSIAPFEFEISNGIRELDLVCHELSLREVTMEEADFEERVATA